MCCELKFIPHRPAAHWTAEKVRMMPLRFIYFNKQIFVQK